LERIPVPKLLWLAKMNNKQDKKEVPQDPRAEWEKVLTEDLPQIEAIKKLYDKIREIKNG
jgi:hypothetical protein